MPPSKPNEAQQKLDKALEDAGLNQCRIQLDFTLAWKGEGIILFNSLDFIEAGVKATMKDVEIIMPGHITNVRVPGRFKPRSIPRK